MLFTLPGIVQHHQLWAIHHVRIWITMFGLILTPPPAAASGFPCISYWLLTASIAAIILICCCYIAVAAALSPTWAWFQPQKPQNTTAHYVLYASASSIISQPFAGLTCIRCSWWGGNDAVYHRVACLMSFSSLWWFVMIWFLYSFNLFFLA